MRSVRRGVLLFALQRIFRRPSLVAQFGEQVVSPVNLERGRVDPNFALDLAMGAELYRKELRTLQFQLQATTSRIA
jgi:hypothetical protein